MKPAITDIPLNELPDLVVADLGLKRFAAGQIIAWLYERRVTSFAEMTNLSKDARALLEERFVIDAIALEETLSAADGTQKYLCRTRDGQAIECVLIPADGDRITVCLSTQVGCAMDCAFCRTARMGFKRNLTQGEILGQLLAIMRSSSARVTNVVLMGMGEPLANAEAVTNAIEVFIDDRAFNLAKRRITLSTAGLIPELEAFPLRYEIKIAISLNATTDAVRDRIMPINRKYPIAQIMAFCRDYAEHSRHRVTFEYVLIGGVNDTVADANRLVALLHGVPAKVNLIPFNPFPGSDLNAPLPAAIERFSQVLFDRGIQTNVRVSRGAEILAACGQLAAGESTI